MIAKREKTESPQVSTTVVPLCFASFVRENYRRVANSEKGGLAYETVEEITGDNKSILDSKVQPLSHVEFQISDKISNPGTYYELIPSDSLPLCFNSL
jgi:hypothetical protein